MKNIAVIMAVYSGDDFEYLKDSLHSLYNQTYKNFDIFIQCDGLLESNVSMFLNFEHSSKRVFFLQKRRVNKGLAYSLNELLMVVLTMDYEYIARMDADDICKPDRFYKQFIFMENNKNCDIVGSNILEFYDDGLERLVAYKTSNKEIKSDFATKTAIPHVSAFFRKSFFNKAGLYNTSSNRNEDQWLWLSGFMSGCVFSSIPDVLVKVRLSSNLLSRRGDFIHAFDTFKLRNRIIYLLRFNKVYYLYNILVFFIKIQPLWILKIIYKLR